MFLGNALRRRAFKRWLKDIPQLPTSSLENTQKWLESGLKIKGIALSEEEFIQILRVVVPYWNQSRPIDLWATAGLYQQASLLGALVDRVVAKLVPAPEDPYDLVPVVALMDTGWSCPKLQNAPEIAELNLAWEHFLHSSRGALILLTSEVRAGLYSYSIRKRIQSHVTLENLLGSPGARLERFSAEMSSIGSKEFVEGISKWISECEMQIQKVYASMEHAGVDVGLVYQLERLESALGRIRALSQVLAHQNPTLKAWESLLNLLMLVGAQIREERGVRALLKANLHLLSRKIVERSSETGEHYIAKNQSEYRGMFWGAVGGGIITTATVIAKFWIALKKLPLFFEFFFQTANFGASFLLMQVLGFKLATKQPSMTAAVLAARFKEVDPLRPGEFDFQKFENEVAEITRSQFAAAAGNLIAVIPSVALVNAAYFSVFGVAMLDHHTAQYAIKSLHPFKTFTLVYAAWTGVLLWMSSVAAGWIDNWIVLRDLPKALSAKFGKTVSAWVERSMGGAGGNLTLAGLLAATPVVGKFFGMGLDVRHVTLSTGALTLGVLSLSSAREPVLDWNEVAWAGLGILCIGALNFGVSFWMALRVAAQARNIDPWIVRKTLWRVFLGFLRAPRKFIGL